MWARVAHHPLDALKAEPLPHTCHPRAWAGATLTESLVSWWLPLSMYRPYELDLGLLGTGVGWGCIPTHPQSLQTLTQLALTNSRQVEVCRALPPVSLIYSGAEEPGEKWDPWLGSPFP